MGSLFAIHSITAKDMRHVSVLPGEEEVLFLPREDPYPVLLRPNSIPE